MAFRENERPSKLAPARLRPINQGVITAGSAVNFMHFVTDTYEKTALPLLSSAVQKTYLGAIRKHLAPVFGNSCLRDLTPVTMQTYFFRFACEGCRVSHHRESARRFVEHSARRGGIRVLAEEPAGDLAARA